MSMLPDMIQDEEDGPAVCEIHSLIKVRRDCPDCEGEGIVVDELSHSLMDPCGTCDGSGYVEVCNECERELSLKK